MISSELPCCILKFFCLYCMLNVLDSFVLDEQCKLQYCYVTVCISRCTVNCRNFLKDESLGLHIYTQVAILRCPENDGSIRS